MFYFRIGKKIQMYVIIKYNNQNNLNLKKKKRQRLNIFKNCFLFKNIICNILKLYDKSFSKYVGSYQ